MSDHRDIAPEAGHRAHVLPTGEVRGGGAGAGGGNPSEEYDSDEQGTGQPAPTGVDAATKGTPAQGDGDREPGGLR